MTNTSKLATSWPHLIICLLLAVGAAACEGAGTEADAPRTAAAEHEALARTYIDAYNDRDLAALEEILADPLRLNGEDLARDEFLGLVQGYWDGFPDFELAPTHIVGADEHVTVRMEFSGTGEGEFLGYDVDGKEIQASEIILFHVSDGRLDEYWDEWDALGFWEQLDVIESP